MMNISKKIVEGLECECLWAPSPNYGRSIRYIIIHGTGLRSNEEALARLRDPKHEVSSHYFINSEGILYQLVKDDEVAWHAGISRWGEDRNLNYTSLGIELFNSSAGNKFPYTDEQYSTLIKLLQHLITKYQIHIGNVLGHSDIAPGRKTDPGYLFDWEKLYQANVASASIEIDKNRKRLFNQCML